MKLYEGHTRQTRHKTQKKQKTLLKEENLHCFKFLNYENLNKTKTLRRRQHTGYENYLHCLYKRYNKRRSTRRKTNGYKNAKVKIKS